MNLVQVIPNIFTFKGIVNVYSLRSGTHSFLVAFRRGNVLGELWDPRGAILVRWISIFPCSFILNELRLC